MTPEECYAACEGLTELGRELSRLNVKITLEKPIPVLGIPAGTVKSRLSRALAILARDRHLLDIGEQR